MDIETRLTNLENLVNHLIDLQIGNKEYTDADIAGCRQGISEVTPWEETKTAYIDDTEVVFAGVPKGNMTVYADPLMASYTITQDGDTVTVSFDAREEVTKITLSII